MTKINGRIGNYVDLSLIQKMKLTEVQMKINTSYRTFLLPRLPAKPGHNHAGRRAVMHSLCLGGGSLVLLAGAMFSLPALAAISDTMHPFAAVSYLYDDNLFRLPDAAAGGDSNRSDTYKSVSGGLLFERPIGRQLLSGQAKLSKVTFDRFDQLNYDGKDMLAALTWYLGNHVDGHAGISYTQTLAPYADFTTLTTGERNLRVQKREYVDGNWRFHPSWQVHAGFTREKYEYDLAALRFSNRTEDASLLGIDYLASSNSRVGVQLRRLKGVYSDQQSTGTTVIDSDYEQTEAKANIYWVFSGTTQVQFLGGWVQRKHAFFTSRDTSGTNNRLVLTWAPLKKVNFTVTGWREFSAIESSFFSSALIKGASVGATWNVSTKVRLDANLKHEKREFSSAIGMVSPLGASDLTRPITLGVTYAPASGIQLGMNAFHETRSGSAAIGTNSYRANGVSFNANGQF